MSDVRKLRVVSMDFVLLEHDLFGRPKSACVGWVCNVGSLELYSIQNGSLTGMDLWVSLFILGPKIIFMVDNDQRG